MSVIVKCGGGKSSGLYVWAKYNADIGLGESINNIALANDGTSIDIYVKENLYIKEDGTIGVQGEPYSTVSISSVVEDTCIGGMTPTKYCIGVDGNVYSSPLSHIASSVDNCVANLVKVVKGNFIEYVVSDNPNKYPSDGEYGNYYYVTTEDVTPEVTAQTPVITQIAGNLGVTITTPSGTNKQILQGNNANLLNIKNNAKKEGAYVWKKLTAQAGNFVDFVVSDSETAYPDGGTQDGYWYELVEDGLPPEMFGCTKYAIDKFTFTETTYLNEHLPHSLGEAPKFVFCLVDTKYGMSVYKSAIAVCGYSEDITNMIREPYGIMGFIDAYTSESDNNIIAYNGTVYVAKNYVMLQNNTNYTFAIGHEYTLITMI